MTHICISKLTIIGSDNGLLPGWCQAIIWTNDGILLIGHLETNFNEILIKIHTKSIKKIYLKMSSGKWCPFCLGLNVLTHWPLGDMNEATLSDCEIAVRLCHWTLLMISQHYVIARCCQATSHYLSQCWPSSISPYSFSRPQWVKTPDTLILLVSFNCE